MHIVTGGAGFIGSAYVWKLNVEGVDDVLIVDDLGTDEKWKNLAGLKFTDFLHKDVFLEMVLDDSLPGDVHSVVHMGACSSTTEVDANYLMENNYRYSQALAQWCLERGVRMVNASSAATYGDGSRGFDDDEDRLEELRPLNMYGYTKQLFDLWARRTGALGDIASLKFFNVFGPNEYHKGDMMSVVCKAFSQIQETGKLKLFKSYRGDYPDGGQMRDFIYVKDCLDVIWWLVGNPDVGGVFNVGTGKARTWNDLAAAVFAAMGRPLNVEYIDMPEHLQGKYQYFTEANMEKLSAAGCPVEFTSLEDGVADYVKNYLAADDPYLSA
jgi:ADP-L-glycero-D-manno-heptose 6-epimerase